MVRTLFIYIVLVSPATAIFEECRCCFPLYFVELLTVMSTKIVSCLVVCSSPSDQSNFVEPKVNLLIKDTQSKRHWAKLNRSSRRSAPINPNGAPAEWSKLWTTWSTPAPSSELDDKTIKWLEKTDIPVWIGKNYHTNDDCIPRGTCYCHIKKDFSTVWLSPALPRINQPSLNQ